MSEDNYAVRIVPRAGIEVVWAVPQDEGGAVTAKGSKKEEPMKEGIDRASNALAIIQAAWNAGAKPWNAEALTSVYAADALFFGGRPGHSVGTDAIRAYFASYDGVIESASLDLVEQRFIALGEDCFLAQGYGEFAFELSGNQRSRSRLRTTLVIALRQREWRILQHHFSTSPDMPPI